MGKVVGTKLPPDEMKQFKILVSLRKSTPSKTLQHIIREALRKEGLWPPPPPNAATPTQWSN